MTYDQSHVDGENPSQSQIIGEQDEVIIPDDADGKLFKFNLSPDKRIEIENKHPCHTFMFMVSTRVFESHNVFVEITDNTPMIIGHKKKKKLNSINFYEYDSVFNFPKAIAVGVGATAIAGVALWGIIRARNKP